MDDTVLRMVHLMKLRQMDQKTLALKLGIRPQAITEWKNGVTTSYSKRIVEIAKILGTTPGYLLTGKEESEALSDSGLSPAEQSLISLYRTLPPDERAAVIKLVQAAATGKESP